MSKVLITGGTGMIGAKISAKLREQGHEVRHLSRNANLDAEFPAYEWDLKHQKIDEAAFDEVSIIVHLAGASINQRWTDQNKKVIIGSRVESANLLFSYAKKLNLPLQSFVSMSAIGYYGGDTGDKLLRENDPPGNDFLADVVKKWEAAADQFESICPVTKLRTGVVLSMEGGALPKIALPTRFGLGAPIGSGKQVMSWIHIDDVVGAFYAAVAGKIKGTMNLVAPHPVTNQEFSKQLAAALHRPFFFPNVPAFILRLFLGEMSIIVTGGNNASSDELTKAGYTFKYAELSNTLKDLVD